MAKKMTIEDVRMMWNQWLFTYPEGFRNVNKDTGEEKRLDHNIDQIESSFERILEIMNEPMVLVKRDGKIEFNEIAKNFEIVDEVTDAIELSIAMDYFRTLPVIITLTNCLRMLAEFNPDLKIHRLKVKIPLDKNDPAWKM